jgi:hypothetical protein
MAWTHVCHAITSKPLMSPDKRMSVRHYGRLIIRRLIGLGTALIPFFFIARGAVDDARIMIPSNALNKRNHQKWLMPLLLFPK